MNQQAAALGLPFNFNPSLANPLLNPNFGAFGVPTN